ncbi:class I SAM-dependent methyltransferase [Pseudonocardia kunmingensis]|uniref:Methyltransferase family protein n=1 Tax=Pseudonocardia kunmingensis TaxID=630975 RepID=A0A543E3P6_9PSEU|nr:methyltransferase domain-containing protein [Pseudonocardia kunmingensis]TQM16200.1 methyltransferase family protein [Pseudonocardia kunmingensis]
MSEGPPGWGAPLHERVLDLAGVGPGTAVLDLGCGPGTFAAAAVARGARVVGIDGDPSAVAVASAAVPAATFRRGDAHDPPPGPFDVVAAVQVLAHVANPLAVLRAAARVGSAVAVTTWGPEEECDVRAFGEALAPWLPPRRPPSGPPPLTDPARLRKVVGIAGLVVVAEEPVECRFTYPDADALVRPLLASGIGRAAAARAGDRAVRRAVLDRLAVNRTRTGGYVLLNRFRALVARPRRP